MACEVKRDRVFLQASNTRLLCYVLRHNQEIYWSDPATHAGLVDKDEVGGRSGRILFTLI